MNLFAGMIRGSQYPLGPYVGSVCIRTGGKKCEKMTNKQRPRNRIDELDRCVLQQASSFLSCWRFLNFKKRENKKSKASFGGRCVWAHGCNKCSFIGKMAEVFPLENGTLNNLTPTTLFPSHESQPASSPRSDGREASRTSRNKRTNGFPPC